MESMAPSPSHPDPVHGPRVLFFSGGTALRGVSRLLPAWTHRSIHLVTPFDSGGSSAPLREALGMPAPGDLRNRILALADASTPESRARHYLLAHRLPAEGSPTALRGELCRLSRALPPEVVPHLAASLDALPRSFDLRRASVGNLVLAGLWLAEERSLARAAEAFSRLMGVRGTVRPVSEEPLHLAAELADGTVLVGQHAITRDGSQPIVRLFLVPSLDRPEPAAANASAEVLDLIAGADLICFPMGSFFTSVVASLLPDGIAAVVAASSAPKVYLPNAGGDPEERGLGPEERVRVLARHLHPLPPSEIRVLEIPAAGGGDGVRYEDAAVLAAIQAAIPPTAPGR